jgi:hypothetical protein
VDDIKKMKKEKKKKKHKVATSYWADQTREAITMNFFPSPGVKMVIILPNLVPIGRGVFAG